MKNFDLKKIRTALPHGAISEIAERMDVDPRFVSEIFNEGWHKDRRNEAVNFALEILKRTDLDPEVIKAAAAMQLTTDSPVSFRSHKTNKKRREPKSKANFLGNMSPLLLGAVALVAYLFLSKKAPATN